VQEDVETWDMMGMSTWWTWEIGSPDGKVDMMGRGPWCAGGHGELGCDGY